MKQTRQFVNLRFFTTPLGYCEDGGSKFLLNIDNYLPIDDMGAETTHLAVYPLGAMHPLYRTGVPLISRESFLYI
jgi:hypothetical protein